MTDDTPENQPPAKFHDKAFAHASLRAIARVLGPEGVLDFLVKWLRISDDGMDQALADLMDPNTATDISVTVTLGWSDHANPARDLEIAGLVEWHVTRGKTKQQAVGIAADEYGLKDKTVKDLWLKHRKKIRDDAALLAEFLEDQH
ncbi:hypothetical protein FHT86_003506 [Rhizobium sp. BK313]|uniref:hypothetical protein n=1 Tax=Rhizobium sp. BK313 TaxID=2587081 RepID=UPI00105FFC74|nr:hypothetical protein [Rhizobium sp. BK313]MBB3455207.1 hypothetical protein [Rhizobium sp. BK313]